MNYLGLDRQSNLEVVKNLNELLANYHIYYQNLRNFHWNVTGENFFELHAEFETLYNDARLKIDAIAERILTLRERPVSTLSEYLATSEVAEAKYVETDLEMVKTIIENHKILIEKMRDTLKIAASNDDEGTIDMIGGFLEETEKKTWMLDAWATRKTKMKIA